MYFAEPENIRNECAAYWLLDGKREKIAHDETWLYEVKKVMLDERQYTAAPNEQASKNSPARLSGLVVKNEKQAYRREWCLSVACLRKSMVISIEAKSW